MSGLGQSEAPAQDAAESAFEDGLPRSPAIEPLVRAHDPSSQIEALCHAVLPRGGECRINQPFARVSHEARVRALLPAALPRAQPSR